MLEICPANKSQITTMANSFLLNIAEHEIFSANKYENASNKFSVLINMKMPTIVGIFIFIRRENFMFSRVEKKNIL